MTAEVYSLNAERAARAGHTLPGAACGACGAPADPLTAAAIAAVWDDAYRSGLAAGRAMRSPRPVTVIRGGKGARSHRSARKGGAR